MTAEGRKQKATSPLLYRSRECSYRKHWFCSQDGRKFMIKGINQVGKGREVKRDTTCISSNLFLARGRKKGCLLIVIFAHLCTFEPLPWRLFHISDICVFSVSFADCMLLCTSWIASLETDLAGFSSHFFYSSQGLQLPHRCIQFSIACFDCSYAPDPHPCDCYPGVTATWVSHKHLCENLKFTFQNCRWNGTGFHFKYYFTQV